MTSFVDETVAQESESLVLLLDKVLESVEQCYAQAGVSLPERRYWSLADPAVDCEQLVVTLLQAYIGNPGDEASLPQNCNAIMSASLQVQVHRCVPTVGPKGKALSATAIQTASRALAVDAYLLLSSARYLDPWDPAGPSLGVIATVDVQPVQGGYQGVILNLTVAIP